MSQIPYYDSDAHETLLNFVSEATAKRYIAEGTARAVRRCKGQIARLYRIGRELVPRTAREGIACLSAAASRTTRPVRADRSCKQHLTGQLLGNSVTVREHIPARRDKKVGHSLNVAAVGPSPLPERTREDLKEICPTPIRRDPSLPWSAENAVCSGDRTTWLSF